jgi:putative hydrolase of the HAD superfamily
VHLLIDGDDTLWENNVHFERAIEAFIDRLDHSTLSRDEVRAVLDEVERVNLTRHGYGSAAFAENLAESWLRLAESHPSEEELAAVRALGRAVAEQPLELLAGVEETLAYLAPRHDLTLVTKGKLDEQRLKVEASGLEAYFARVEIVPEKDSGTYRRLVAEHGFDPERTWMIGNSPRSDINPAVGAGLRAVFIPHPMTWRLEEEAVAADERILVLTEFTELRDHF